MTIVAGTFTAVGVSAPLNTKNTTEEITVTFSGTYAATVQLERSTTPAMLSWEVVAGPFSTANATVTRIVTSRPNDRFRVRCTAFTSGTVNYTFSDGDQVLREIIDLDGNVIQRITQAGNGGDLTAIESSIATLQTQIPSVSGLVFNSFILRLVNTGGTMQHRISNWDVLSPGAPTYASVINGATSALTNTPNGTDASTAMAAGGKISSATTHLFCFDTVVQDPTQALFNAVISQTNQGDAISVRSDFISLNINGVTRVRPAIQLMLAGAGTGLAINTTNFGSGQFLDVIITGWFNS